MSECIFRGKNMVYREYMKYANPKCTGIFLGGETRDYPIIAGYTNKYNPIIGEIWKCMDRPFTISKRSGMRLDLAIDLACITVYRTVHGQFTDRDWIHMDSIVVTNGLVTAFNGSQSLKTKTVRCLSGDKEVNITFANDDEMFFIAVHRSGATSLDEITIKHWDLPFVHCDYKVVV